MYCYLLSFQLLLIYYLWTFLNKLLKYTQKNMFTSYTSYDFIMKARSLWILGHQEVIKEIRYYATFGRTDRLKDQKFWGKSLNSLAIDENVRACRELLEWRHKVGRVDVSEELLAFHCCCLCELTAKDQLVSRARNWWGELVMEQMRTSWNSASVPHYLKWWWLSKCNGFYIFRCSCVLGT